MSFTVQDCITEAQALLNDQAGQLFTNTVLLPYFKKAHDELGWKLELNDVPVLFQDGVTQNFGAATIVQTFTLPADFMDPIECHEKAQGQPDVNYVLVTRVTFLPDLSADESFNFWMYNQQNVVFPPVLTARTVRLRYRMLVPNINGVGDTVTIVNAKTYLSSRTAALAAFTIGENPDRASALQDDADGAINMLIALSVKNNQALRTRRRPFTVGPWYR